jgi:hypothetical protein
MQAVHQQESLTLRTAARSRKAEVCQQRHNCKATTATATRRPRDGDLGKQGTEPNRRLGLGRKAQGAGDFQKRGHRDQTPRLAAALRPSAGDQASILRSAIPLHSLSAMPPTDSASRDIDPLVAQTTKKLAHIINDFKREQDRRNGVWATINGTIELSLQRDGSQTYTLSIQPDEDGDEYPVTITAVQKRARGVVNNHHVPVTPLITAATSSGVYKPTRRASDAELEKELVSRKKRQLDGDDDDSSHKRLRVEDDEDIMPLITKEDLQMLLVQLREDVQEDTSECVNHVQKLLRRFKEEWHEKTKWDDEQLVTQTRAPLRDSVAATTAFPSPGHDRSDDQNMTLPDIIRKESRLLSSQVLWVEECRRVAADIHDKREETWRTSSASFHEHARLDRESFQNRILHESTLQGRMLNQILSEVKAVGNYALSLKWETPGNITPYAPVPSTPAAPAFPTQAPSTGAGSGRGRGRGRGTGSKT